uniref:Flagellar export protein FliJ n=1 Tax=Haemonchus contortus TaxID=6289 RepID=A0A7I4Y524_HAECO
MKTLDQRIEVIDKGLAKAENRLQMEKSEQASTEVIMVRKVTREEEDQEKILTDDEYMDRLFEETVRKKGKGMMRLSNPELR